ncbi:MAG TPA: hypothetical protein VFF28_05355 [Candidatus Nanoarchaeia archaeon]|nr:hypothetical protein [Candidatus Nanoarchaeia archaeon]
MKAWLLLAVLIIAGCSKQAILEKEIEIKPSCGLEGDINCIGLNATNRMILLHLENQAADDFLITEIKLYGAGTCGGERLDGEMLPYLLKSHSQGIIQAVCNTLPESGRFDSPVLLRYKNPKDMILRTIKGNITAEIK